MVVPSPGVVPLHSIEQEGLGPRVGRSLNSEIGSAGEGVYETHSISTRDAGLKEQR